MPSYFWDKDEIDYLREAAQTTPSAEIAHHLGRSQAAVRFKAREKGIMLQVERKADGGLRRRWTKREVFQLQGLAETMSTAQAAKALGRSVPAVKNKAKKLGISFTEKRLTLPEVAELLKVSFSTVTRHRDLLGLKFRTLDVNGHHPSGHSRGATGADIVAIAKNLLANPPPGRGYTKATALHLRKVIQEYEGWE